VFGGSTEYSSRVTLRLGALRSRAKFMRLWSPDQNGAERPKSDIGALTAANCAGF